MPQAPEGTKKPQDHKGARKRLVSREVGGVEFEVKTVALTDARVLGSLQRGEVDAVVRKVFGDRADELYKLLEDADGFADVERVAEEVGKFYEELEEGK